MTAVSVQNIEMSYGDVKALKGVSFDVDKGEIFGIIGPDGAGKTSLFRILTTLLLPASGKATVDGHDVVTDYQTIREHVGYMPGRFSLYQDLSVRENLELFAAVFNTTVGENYHLIEEIYIQLEPFKDRRAGKLSGGMKQKLALCCALIHKPTVLFLDEPTTGVDPVSRTEFWDMLHNLKEMGITILVSTPYMDEASRCDRIGLIQDGAFLTINTPKAIEAEFKQPLFSVTSNNMYKLLLDLREESEIKWAFAFGDTVHALFHKEPTETGSLVKRLQEKGQENVNIQRIDPTIEDCFMDLSENQREE